MSVARAKLLRRHAAHARVNQGWARTIAREHAVLAATVVDLGVSHAPNDRQLIGNLRRLLHVRAESHAGLACVSIASRIPRYSDGCVGLRVEAVHVGEAALEIDVDHRGRLRSRALWPAPAARAAASSFRNEPSERPSPPSQPTRRMSRAGRTAEVAGSACQVPGCWSRHVDPPLEGSIRVSVTPL